MGIILDLHASDGAKKEKKERGKRRVGPLFLSAMGRGRWVRPSVCVQYRSLSRKRRGIIVLSQRFGREIVKSSENYYGQHMFSNVFSFRISFLPLSSASISMLDLLSILLSECVSSPCCWTGRQWSVNPSSRLPKISCPKISCVGRVDPPWLTLRPMP